MGILSTMSTDIGIDLGTANTLVHLRGKGIILSEPSVIAIDKNSGRVVAVGAEAKRMIGRTPGNIAAIRPVRKGIIADYETTRQLLNLLLAQVKRSHVQGRLRVVIGTPSDITDVDKRAIVDACLAAGAAEAFLIEEALAAALGAGISVEQRQGAMVVDIGGGTTEIAVIVSGRIVSGMSIQVGGDEMDQAIVSYVRQQYKILIGERSAEEVKIQLTALKNELHANARVLVSGRDLQSGLPRALSLEIAEIAAVLSASMARIAEAVKAVTEKIPPELWHDVRSTGIVLTGGGALLAGFPEYLMERLDIPVRCAVQPLECVGIGTGKVLEYPEIMNRLAKTAFMRSKGC